jgi:hypothetical protein
MGLGLRSTDSDTNRQDYSHRPSIPIDRASFFNLLNGHTARAVSIMPRSGLAKRSTSRKQLRCLNLAASTLAASTLEEMPGGLSLKDDSVHQRRTHLGDSRRPAEAPMAASSL